MPTRKEGQQQRQRKEKKDRLKETQGGVCMVCGRENHGSAEDGGPQVELGHRRRFPRAQPCGRLLRSLHLLILCSFTWSVLVVVLVVVAVVVLVFIVVVLVVIIVVLLTRSS